MMSLQRNNHPQSIEKRKKNQKSKREADDLNKRMTGLLSQLTEEQRRFLLNYDGEEVSGCFYDEDIK